MKVLVERTGTGFDGHVVDVGEPPPGIDGAMLAIYSDDNSFHILLRQTGRVKWFGDIPIEIYNPTGE